MKKEGVLPVYNSVDLYFDHGDGVYLYTEDGTRYLDFTSGIGVTCLGHSHPALVSALREQAGKLWHCSNLFKIKGQETVAKKIVDHSFASNVFFCNSGAEAVEAGIKAVIQPGGSMRDEEVIAAADEHGIAMVFTGMRHFRH